RRGARWRCRAWRSRPAAAAGARGWRCRRRSGWRGGERGWDRPCGPPLFRAPYPTGAGSVAALAHRLARRAAGRGTVVDADPVAHVAYAARGSGEILGTMLHRARRHVAGQGGDAAFDLEQDLAGV